MGIRKKFEQWILKNEFNQDTFQTFVCWMLFGGMVGSFFAPAYLVLLQPDQEHCPDGTFTILAHFRIHSWLYEMFEDYKQYQTDYDNICFELVISDSQFSSSKEPSLWIPENLVWLDEAESDDGIYGSDLVSSTSENCDNITNIPMGLVTWQQYADALNYTYPLKISDFLDLATNGWSSYTGNNDIDWQNVLEFSHSHPDVTSSGVLGMILNIQSLSDNLDAGDSYTYTKTDYQSQNYSEQLKIIEHNITELGPNELTGISNFLGKGPDYIQAMYGFENDVAYNNYLYGDLLDALWDGNDLAFVYFESTFWMTHPACVLSESTWVDDNDDLLAIANDFQEFITSSDRTEGLLEYGIRPYDLTNTTLEDSEIISSNYGVNPYITDIESVRLGFPDYSTIDSIRTQWRDIKRPVYLRLLLDTSFYMQTPITTSSDSTRWSYAIEGLTYFADSDFMGDDSVYEIQCFANGMRACGDTFFPVNGTEDTLGSDATEDSDYSSLGEEIIAYLDAESIATSGEEVVSLYRSLNTSLTELRQLQSENNEFNYVLVVISEDNDDSDGTLTSDDLLDIVGINYSPDDVHVFPIAFWAEDSETIETLEEIAIRTNGEYYSTQKRYGRCFRRNWMVFLN